MAALESASPAEVVITPLAASDAPRCAGLESELFPEDSPWPEGAFRSEIAASHNSYFAARSGGQLVGYAGISRLGPTRDPEFEIHTIGVDPQWQGQGIGRVLLESILEIAESSNGPVYLDVRTDNYAALGLYKAHSFEVVGLRKNYYRPSRADAFVMLRLPESSRKNQS